MADSVSVEHVEQLALWRQWVAEKQRSVPSALRPWERQLLCWDARAPLDREGWKFLRRWAEKAGLVNRQASLVHRNRYRGEL